MASFLCKQLSVLLYDDICNVSRNEGMHALSRLFLQCALNEEMTEDNSTTSDMSDAMTATEETQITQVNTVTSSSSSNITFYFQLAVLVIGVIGTAANALILYAMVASKQHMKHLLILNQNALDLFSCFFLVITYALQLLDISLVGSLGYWLCTLIISDTFVWVGNAGAVINLAIITIERYLIVVHSAWSKKKLREWMRYSAMAFTWIGPAVYLITLTFSTTVLISGMCYPFTVFKSKYAKYSYYIFYILTFYVVILFIFIFCYRILIVIRRQAQVMASHTTPQSITTQTQLNQIQTNVIKTMVFVCAFYAVLWLPYYVCVLLWYVVGVTNLNEQILLAFYYVSVFSGFLYTCMNPFIYATKFEPVKQVILGMIPWKKTAEQANENVANAGIGLAACRAGNAHARN